jgi:hypothetical protein
MSPKTKRARQGGNPNLAPTPNQFAINKESCTMVTKNTATIKRATNGQANKTITSWSSHGKNSVFGYEMSIAADPTCHGFLPPNPLFTWLKVNNLNNHLYKALDLLCPLFPVNCYPDQPSIWLSPPPSGAGNSVGIIIVRDNHNCLKMYGTNFMSDPTRAVNTPNPHLLNALNLMAGNSMGTSRLIEDEISAQMTSGNYERAKEIESEAFKFRTMSVYILVIDGAKTYMGMDVAIATAARRPSDMSYEFAGEIV